MIYVIGKNFVMQGESEELKKAICTDHHIDDFYAYKLKAYDQYADEDAFCAAFCESCQGIVYGMYVFPYANQIVESPKTYFPKKGWELVDIPENPMGITVPTVNILSIDKAIELVELLLGIFASYGLTKIDGMEPIGGDCTIFTEGMRIMEKPTINPPVDAETLVDSYNKLCDYMFKTGLVKEVSE